MGLSTDIRAVRDNDSLMFITANGMLVRISANDIRTIGRNTKGVRVVNLKDGDRLIAAAKVEGIEETAETEVPSQQNKAIPCQRLEILYPCSMSLNQWSDDIIILELLDEPDFSEDNRYYARNVEE